MLAQPPSAPTLDPAEKLARVPKLFIAQTKAVGTGGARYQVICSTQDEDRDGDVIHQDGWDLRHFLQRPILLSSHDYSRLTNQIGEWDRDSLKIINVNGIPALTGVCEFYTGRGNDEADWGAFLASRNLLAVSVGFRPLDYRPRRPSSDALENEFFGNWEFIRQELLEISAVLVPAHQDAVQAMLGTKNLHPALKDLGERMLRDFASITPHSYPAAGGKTMASSANGTASGANELIPGFGLKTLASQCMGPQCDHVPIVEVPLCRDHMLMLTQLPPLEGIGEDWYDDDAGEGPDFDFDAPDAAPIGPQMKALLRTLGVVRRQVKSLTRRGKSLSKTDMAALRQAHTMLADMAEGVHCGEYATAHKAEGAADLDAGAASKALIQDAARLGAIVHMQAHLDGAPLSAEIVGRMLRTQAALADAIGKAGREFSAENLDHLKTAHHALAAACEGIHCDEWKDAHPTPPPAPGEKPGDAAADHEPDNDADDADAKPGAGAKTLAESSAGAGGAVVGEDFKAKADGAGDAPGTGCGCCGQCTDDCEGDCCDQCTMDEANKAARAAAAKALAEAVAKSAVGVHHTPTTDTPWDAAENEKRLGTEADEAALRGMYAIVDGPAKTDAKLPHHMVSADGKPGAANTNGCSAAIGALNGARGGMSGGDAERQGAFAHLRAHLLDAHKGEPDYTPPDLKEFTTAAGEIDWHAAIKEAMSLLQKGA